MYKRGFTLIEILVVVSIIGMLASIVLASLNSARNKGRVAAALSFAGQVYRSTGDNAVGLWDFNESSGNALDLSGNGNTGTLASGAARNTSTPNGAGSSVTFNGTSAYINVPYSSSLAPTSAITFGAWFLTTNTTQDQRILSKTESGGYHLAVNEASFCPNQICAIINVGGVYYTVTYTLAPLADGQWHHAIVSYDGETLDFYIDGKRVQSNTTPSGPIVYLNANNLCIGMEPSATTCNSASFYNGLLDDVRIYSRGLTAMEVSRLYAQTAPGKVFAGR